jgi:hypothetical protein
VFVREEPSIMFAGTSWWLITKLFFFKTYEWTKYARVFVHGQI